MKVVVECVISRVIDVDTDSCEVAKEFVHNNCISVIGDVHKNGVLVESRCHCITDDRNLRSDDDWENV